MAESSSEIQLIINGVDDGASKTLGDISKLIGDMAQSFDDLSRAIGSAVKSFGDFGKLDSDLSGLSKNIGDITSSADSVSKALSDMSSATSNIKTVQTDFSALATNVTTNSGDITRGIDSIVSDVSKMASDFSTSSQDIVRELQSIATETGTASHEMDVLRSNMNHGIDKIGGLIAIQMLGQSMEHLGQQGEKLFDFAVTQGADFQQSMKNIQVVMAANNDSNETWNQKLKDAAGTTQQLQNLALQLGSRGAQSANEIAGAMDTMLRSGVSAKAVLGGAAKAAQNVSIVTGDSLSDSSALITEIYHQFREEFNSNGKSVQQNMKETGDVISGVLLSSRINATDFLNTMKYTGPVAAQLGTDLNDAAVATALLAQNGIKGSSAGTALRRVFTNLLEPTKAGAAAMQKLGLIQHGQNMVIDQTTGKMKNLTQIQGMLAKSMQGLTAAQKAKYTHDIFEQYAFASSLVLANANTAAYDKLKRSIDGVNSTQAASSMLDTFDGHMRQLQAHVQTTAKEFGMAFLPVLEKLLPIGNKILDWMQSLSPKAKELGMGLLGVGSAFTLIGGALAGFAVSLKFAHEGVTALRDLAGMVPGVRALGPAFTFLKGPWGIVITAIIAGVVLIVTHWKQIVSFAKQHFGIDIPTILRSLGKIFTDIFNGIKSTIKSVWSYVGPYIINGVKAVAAYWKEIWPELRQVLGAVFNGIKLDFKVYLDALKLILSPALGFLKGSWHDAWNAMKDILRLVFDEIKNILKLAWDAVSGSFKVVLDLLTGKWGKAWTDMKSTVGKVWGDIKSLFGDFVNDAMQFGKDFLMGIVHGIEGAVGNVINTVKGVWKSITSIFGGGSSSSSSALPVPNASPASNSPPKIPHFGVGGIVTGPTYALIGESGPEMVLPLNGVNQNSSNYRTGLSGLGGNGFGSKQVNIGNITIVTQAKDAQGITQQLKIQLNRALI